MSNSLPPKPRIVGPKVRICIVASKYNEQYTDALVENAIDAGATRLGASASVAIVSKAS